MHEAVIGTIVYLLLAAEGRRASFEILHFLSLFLAAIAGFRWGGFGGAVFLAIAVHVIVSISGDLESPT